MIYKLKVLPCNLKAKFENFIFTYGVLLIHLQYHFLLPSVLWRCWLGSRKGIRPVKNWVVGCWRGICLELGADLHAAQLMPLPLTISCFIKIQTGFTFLVPAHLGSPGQRAVKWVCVLHCYSVGLCVCWSQLWTLWKWLNRSRDRLGCELGWVEGTMSGAFAQISQGKGQQFFYA